MNQLSEKVEKTLNHYQKLVSIKARSLAYPYLAIKLKQPIFVIGCSRAGTTLVYKTFSESKYLGSLQKETHDFWVQLHPLSDRNWDTHEIEPESANDKDCEFVTRFFYTQTGKRRIVDKNNQNGLSVPYLYRLFPDAHFVYIKRNPGDNIDSLINGWNKADEFGTWADELPEEIAIDNGKYKRWCFFLAESWRQLTRSTIEEVCAFQYKTMNEAIISAKKTIPVEQWHEVSYESLITDPVEEFKRLFNGCSVPFDQSMQNHCRSVLNKPYNTFSEIGVEKWKNSVNRERIERVLDSVSGLSETIGY